MCAHSKSIGSAKNSASLAKALVSFGRGLAVLRVAEITSVDHTAKARSLR